MLAAVVLLSYTMTDFPSFNAWGDNEYYPGMTMLSGSENWKFFCIDSYELLHEAGGVQGSNEWYAYVIPSTRLSDDEVAVLFWATLSLRASLDDGAEYRSIIKLINNKASEAGLVPINKFVTESDMKTIIHLKSTRDKYPWLNAVIDHDEKYMEMAGLLGSSGATSTGGKSIPAILLPHKHPTNAFSIDSSTFTIPFDDTGADKDFIQKVPLEFSFDGGEPWSPEPIGGWVYQKTDTSIVFSNPNPEPPNVMIRFNTKGTEYQKSGGYESVQAAYDKALQLWVCIECNDRHVYHSQKKLPLEAHQRLVYMFLEESPENYYASIGSTSPIGSATGTLQFQVYRHEEDMESTYNVQLFKYDHETGKPLENSVFKLYERFDDQDKIDKYRDGPVHIYEGGEPYKSYHTDNPATWDGFRFVSGVSTDDNGHASKTINHGYHYDKTFCDGHPAPQFVAVPEEEVQEEEESGESTITNGAEIEAAQAENKRLAQAWLTCYAACKAHAAGDFEGVHFHWLMPEVDMGEIERILDSGGDPGETPDAGLTTSASGEESYQESGCQEDCMQTYEKFISLRYSYAFVESKSREGYVIHGAHSDDLPVEVITTDSSEHGANATFAHVYGKDIQINDSIAYGLADETLTAREKIASYRLSDKEFGKPEDIRLAKESGRYRQQIKRFPISHVATDSNAEEWSEETELINDIHDGISVPNHQATPSVALSAALPVASSATPSEAFPATPSNAFSLIPDIFFRTHRPGFPNVMKKNNEEMAESGNALFPAAYNSALNGMSYGDDLEAGPCGNYSHCDGKDGEGDAWRVYDHRTEGEIHINKRDMDLEDGETGGYDSYGDSQGDGTLEGAVYGLFAAADIIHPDGKTGVVYRANNLVAVAATDRNGDASFLVNTEPPGYRYHYESGKIIRTEDGWADQAPANLYISDISYEDYSGDHAYTRTYKNNQEENGSCWIGRPLILGSYYIKELARSEGYELSIGNRDSTLTNRGQDCDVALPVGTGYANISRGLYAEGQISSKPTGDFGNPDINELFFTAESRGTGDNGFDVALSNIPDGARFYRLDTGRETREIETGTGIYEKVYLTNEDGTPRYAVAEHDYQYPKYNPDGSLMTVETSINYRANQIPVMEERPLVTEKTWQAVTAQEPGLEQSQVLDKLDAHFSVDDKDFLKTKVERALRANGKHTPYAFVNGKIAYSSIHGGIYNEGVRKGERDETGISGVRPGELAADTVYGAPLITLEIPVENEDGSQLSTGDLILTILDYYNSSSFLSYGGIHAVSREEGDGAPGSYHVTVYASCNGNPRDFAVLGGSEKGGRIYHRVPYLPDDSLESPRYIYAIYGNQPVRDGFGTYEDYRAEIIGGDSFVTATLITDAAAEGDGSLVSRTVKQNVYYRTGEIPRDEKGKAIQAFEYVEKTVTTTQEIEAHTWTELFPVGTGRKIPGGMGRKFPSGGYRENQPVLRAKDTDGIVVHIDSSYTDQYGKVHHDAALQSYYLRVLLPKKEIALTQDDLDQMQAPGGWSPGEKMGSASYYLNVKGAAAKAFLNYSDLSIIGDSSFVKRVELVYPGQDDVWQDGENRPGTNTRITPAAVQERAIKQKIRITKTIDEDSYSDVNTYAEVHEDWFTRLFGMKGREAGKMGNFRFKVYLKSNLERLYRDEEGQVVWMDRNGNEVDVKAYKSLFPEKVQKIYTKVLHTSDIFKNSKDAVTANEMLYGYTNGLINKTQNPGYTSILEMTGREMRNEEGNFEVVQAPNYQKFFDGIRTANIDRWDNPQSRGRKFTDWNDWDSVRNAWEDAVDPAVWDTSYKPFARIFSGKFSASDAARSSDPPIHDGDETKNERNTSAAAKKNAMSSDAVRQFAIRWYLDREVEKLVQAAAGGGMESKDGPVEYPDELYDIALSEAIKKANNYLTPFFRYDFDDIYSIEWDSSLRGGKDRDPTTLCADLLQEGADEEGDDGADGYYYGISAYLPYGIYVAVEQQPDNHAEGQYDFANRHYKTDAPKEIRLPAVYEPGGETGSFETLAGRYRYQGAFTPEQMAADYQIRFHEEWAENHTDDIRGYVIRAHNANGDFEVYKYGLDVGRLSGEADGKPYAGWKVTQDFYDPIKDYYNDPLVDTKEEGGNPDSHYYADDREGSAQFPEYPSDEIEKYYHYASISEHKALVDRVRVPCDGSCGGACRGKGHVRNDVPSMEGELKAYEGIYAPMLVPWTVLEPADGTTYEAENFIGCADGKFQNTFYSAKLRIEKLDSETGESILHDQAIFAIYAADRDDSETGEGLVKFYEKPTVISGSREFLEAMGAVDLYTRAREIPDPDLAKDALWYGTVSAGTPVCRESEQIVLRDETGNKTGKFRAFTTMRDGRMRPEPDGKVPYPGKAVPTPGETAADQNTGYLELPQPLGAGVYVLAEIKPPSGYVRSKPIAVEVYSDRVTYYLDGDRDRRVAAAVYENVAESGLGKSAEAAIEEQARIYVGNTPVRLEVSKKKTEDETETYRVSGRVEGSITELNGRYGLENLELAYNASGAYLGYGWHKGTIESLAARKAAGENVELFYEAGVFSGYAYITRPLLTADDSNRYVPGAVLTLYDAILVKRNGDSQDYAFDGVTVERDRNSNVTRMYIRQGYAGTKTEFVCQEGEWTYQTTLRPDTDILYYDLGNLAVLSRANDGSLWSYDKEGRPMRIVEGETKSIYALQNKKPVFEIVSSDYSALHYDPMAKAFRTTGQNTVIYHLDADGRRDAMVDSYTGMAYVDGQAAGQENGHPDRQPETVTVWPVNVIKDHDGSVLVKNKIRTSRIATIHADTAQEYITGTYHSDGAGSFEKKLDPIVDKHGQVEYYQRSEEQYRKSLPVYDRDGDFIYDRYSDHLEQYNNDAYMVKEHDDVFDKGQLWDEHDNRNEKLYMRRGDHYILENTWTSGDKTPNDPFSNELSAGQADMLKRVIPGTYIMEELVPSEGYAKAFPVCVAVKETDEIQSAEIVNEKIKIEILKIDAPDDYRQKGVDYDGVKPSEDGSVPGLQPRTMAKGAYTYLPVKGAEMALYRARKVATSDYEAFPAGWYLKKAESKPASWTALDGSNHPVAFTAQWTSGETPYYLEGIPAGAYILEEWKAPPGYIPSTAWLEVKETGEVQTFQIHNDHTKLEIFKYQETDGKKHPIPNTHAARLGLYPAITDEAGRPVMEHGIPLYKEEEPVEIWKTDDCRQYTTLTDLSVYQKWGVWEHIKSFLDGGENRFSGFEHDFEAMYREYGTGFDELHWFYTDEPYDGTGELPNLREGVAYLTESHEADRSGCVAQLWELEDGRVIRITISPEPEPLTGDRLTFEYQYHYRRLEGNMVSYDTREGYHRIDYIPWDGGGEQAGRSASYVLAEIAAPEGYLPAKPKLIVIHETANVQMYALENRREPDRPKPPPEETTPEETTPPDIPEEPETTAPTEPERPEEPKEPTKPETTAPQTTPEVPRTTAPPRPDDEYGTPAVPSSPEADRGTLIGRITARYDGGRDGRGGADWYRSYLSRTGDRFPLWLWMTLFAASGVGMLIVVRRKTYEKKTKNRRDNRRGTRARRSRKNNSTRDMDGCHPASDGHPEITRRKGGDNRGRNESG